MIKQLNRKLYPKALSLWKYKDKVLWYEGDTTLLKMPMVSVVGSRNVTDAGVKRAERITKLLVKAGYCIVSGLAKGIDAVAHKCALDLGGKTIAVLGTPINECYPHNNLALKTTIAQNGLLLSQFPPGQKVSKSNFPLRNTLMAALSEVTIIVEASVNSGTRHQVASAIKMGKKVGFVASVVENDYDWVNQALKNDKVFIISEPYDLSSRLSAFEVPSKKDQRNLNNIIPAPSPSWFHWIIASIGLRNKKSTHYRAP